MKEYINENEINENVINNDQQANEVELYKDWDKFQDFDERENWPDFTEQAKALLQNDPGYKQVQSDEEAREKYEEDWVTEKIAELRDKYLNDKQSFLDDREQVEAYDYGKWKDFITEKKNEGADITRYNRDQRQAYNDELKTVIKNIQVKSIAEGFKMDALRGANQIHPVVAGFSEKELRDAEQIFDKIFMDMNAFYCKHKTGESFLKNFTYIGHTDRRLDSESKDLKNKNIYDYIKTIYNEAGFPEVKEASEEKLEQYAKVTILYSLVNQGAKFKFTPKFFSNPEKGDIVSAENQQDLTFDTEAFILKNNDNKKLCYELEENVVHRVDEVEQIYGKYKREKASDMMKLFPKYEVPKLDPLPVMNDGKENIINEQIIENDVQSKKVERRAPSKEERQKAIEEKKKLRVEEAFNEKVRAFKEKLNGLLNISAYETYIRNIDKLIDNYPELDGRKEELTNAITNMEAMDDANINDATIKRYPGGVSMRFSENPEVIDSYAKAYVIAKGFADEMDRINISKDSPVSEINAGILEIVNKNLLMMDSKRFEDVLKIDPSYYSNYKAIFEAFPLNSFKKNAVDYEADDAKYRAMMSYPIMTQLKERQDHIMEEYLPISHTRAEGSATDDDLKSYRYSYIRNLNKIKNNIKETEKLKDDPRFGEYWQKLEQKNWKANSNSLDTQFSALDRGWPVEDIGLILEMNLVKKQLDAFAEGKDRATEAQAKKARQILETLRNPLNKLESSIITNTDMRDEIIDALEKPISDYIQLRQDIPAGHNRAPYGEPAIKSIYEVAKLREVKPAEMEFRHHRTVDVGFDDIPGLSFNTLKENVDIMMKDLNAVEIAVSGSDEFKKMKESLQELQRFSREELSVPDNPENIRVAYANKLTEFEDKILDTKQKVKKYLARKQKQFNEQRDRREKDGKQTTEQSRIKMSINMLDKLNFVTDMIDEYVSNVAICEKNSYMLGVYPQAKEQAKTRIDQKARNAANVMHNRRTAKNDYILNLGKVLIYAKMEKDENFDMREDEKFSDFRTRISRMGTEELTKKDIDNIAKNDPIIRDILQQEKNKFNNPDYERLDYEAARTLYKNKVREVNGIVVRDERTKKQKDKDEVKDYKNNLVSNKSRQKLQTAKEQKKQKKIEVENAKGHRI